jgi:orotidine-5'-phosphate decarboxylase
MTQIIRREKSIIIACDVGSIDIFRKLIEKTCFIEGIGGYKIGSILTISYGLRALVAAVRDFTDLPIIYDHQKAMTDIPSLGKDFAAAVKQAGADAVIGFPQSGPSTEGSWIKACQECKLSVIIGGEMTHPNYLKSEGGFINDDALDELYLLAARLKVRDFVVPGNKIERIIHYRRMLQSIGCTDLVFYSPGLVTQGGKITEAVKVAGDCWHAIVGRAIYATNDFTSAAIEMTKELLK